jgi:20S proteasome subunit beta 2
MDFVKETGFTFDARRNIEILSQEGIVNMATKTGTTISGIKYAEGIVLGADTRSTSGATVADKNCEKIHFISPNIYCCGAGTAADTEALTGATSFNIKI